MKYLDFLDHIKRVGKELSLRLSEFVYKKGNSLKIKNPKFPWTIPTKPHFSYQWTIRHIKNLEKKLHGGISEWKMIWPRRHIPVLGTWAESFIDVTVYVGWKSVFQTKSVIGKSSKVEFRDIHRIHLSIHIMVERIFQGLLGACFRKKTPCIIIFCVLVDEKAHLKKVKPWVPERSRKTFARICERWRNYAENIHGERAFFSNEWFLTALFWAFLPPRL